MAELETITVQLPAKLVQELNAAGQSVMADLLQRGLRDLYIEQALEQYRRGNISFGAAAAQAGLTQSQTALVSRARQGVLGSWLFKVVMPLAWHGG